MADATDTTESTETTIAVPIPVPVPVPVDPLATVIRETEAFLALSPDIPATSTPIGNTAFGTTEQTPTWGRTRNHPDGAPYRLAIPVNADRIGLETMPNGEVLIRIHSYWSEGGWQNTFARQTGEVVGGLNDVPFPRTDVENKTAANVLQYGTGFWMDVDPENIPLIGATTNEYREVVPFRNLAPGDNSGVPGYSWASTPSGLVIKTPKATLYGLVGFESAVFDPTNGNLAFTQFNSFVLNWSNKGGGKEVSSFAPSYDFVRYPTDPRRTPAEQTHPGPIGAFRQGGDLYVVSGENEILLHKWDAKKRVLIPVAAAYFRPDQLPASIPNHPAIGWGQGAITRAGKTGNFSGEWEVIDAAIHGQRGSSWVYDVDNMDPAGYILFLPKWTKLEDANPVGRWRIIGAGAGPGQGPGVLSPSNLSLMPLPDALRSAEQCEQVRVDWSSGDLVAVVNRGAGWVMERYPSWYRNNDGRKVKAAYSTAPVALGVRRQYPWWATYNAELGVSPDPVEGAPSAGFGSMRVLGGYVFIVEAQAGGVRVHRLSDGAIAGRMADRLHLNSSFDSPTQMGVTQTATEFRVCLLDFHGNAVLVWRVLKKDLAAGVKRAKVAP